MKKRLLAFIMMLAVSAQLSGAGFMYSVKPASTMGIGDAYAANSSGPAAIWLNPAGLQSRIGNQYSLLFGSWIGDLTMLASSALMPMKFGNLAAGVTWFGLQDTPMEDSEGNILSQMMMYRNIAATVSYNRTLLTIPIGISLKFSYSSLGSLSQPVILADFGIMRALGPIVLGAVVKDIGIVSFDARNWGEARFGIAYTAPEMGALDLRLSADYVYTAEGVSSVNAGIEGLMFDTVTLRAGYSPLDYNKFRFGVGVKANLGNLRMVMDYGIDPGIAGLPMSHFIQVTLSSRQREIDMLTQKKISRGDELLGVKDFVKAKAEYLDAFKMDSKSTKALTGLARLNLEQGGFKEALDYCDKVLSLDNSNPDALALKDEISKKVEKSQPEWINNDKYYKESELDFESFQEESSIPKFMSDDGDFTTVTEGTDKYGRWNLVDDKKDSVLRTAIRLPNMSQFDGLALSLKGKGVNILKIILVVQTGKVEQLWEVPVTGITTDWKNMKIPFHYFQLPTDPQATLDLGKIIQIRFMLQKKKGWIALDNVVFYK